MQKDKSSVARGVWSAVICSFISIFVLLIVVTALMFFVFTNKFADFMYDIGANRVASTLYYRAYEKSDDILYCYKALNLKISLNHSEKIVEYYEAFVDDNEYEDFMMATKERNEQLDVGVLEKSGLLNDENYLINKYVDALISIEQEDKALDVALEYFVDLDSVTIQQQGVYALHGFVGEEDLSMFNEKYDGLNDVLYVELQKYFDLSYSIFESNCECTDKVDCAYLMALGNRIISVGQDINTIYEKLGINNELCASNNSVMVRVNEIIKGLL